MNDTPTPRSDKAKIAFTSLFANDDAYWIPYVVGKNLESELTAVTEQRDAMEKNLRIELRGHPDSELWGDAGLIAATMRCVDALDEVTEQRDQWKEKYIQQNKDLGHELRDPNGTIWSECKRLQTQLTAAREELAELKAEYGTWWAQKRIAIDELKEVTEQRDRLAEAVNAATILIAAKGRHNTMLAYNGLRDALQSLNQSPNNA